MSLIHNLHVGTGKKVGFLILKEHYLPDQPFQGVDSLPADRLPYLCLARHKETLCMKDGMQTAEVLVGHGTHMT